MPPMGWRTTRSPSARYACALNQATNVLPCCPHNPSMRALAGLSICIFGWPASSFRLCICTFCCSRNVGKQLRWQSCATPYKLQLLQPNAHHKASSFRLLYISISAPMLPHMAPVCSLQWRYLSPRVRTMLQSSEFLL